MNEALPVVAGVGPWAAANPGWPRLVLLALALASLPLAWWAWRQRGQPPSRRLTALLALTAMLTFDLIVFGAFTRLTDSGLGCPDWPGCYGHASPIGAGGSIALEQAMRPDGPVTAMKAWIEMVHRYLAMTVGLLIVASVVLAVVWRRRQPLPWGWPLATLAWVVVQGLFGKYTVTWKLQPAIVTLHLLGGLGLLALLVGQVAWLRRQGAPSKTVPRGMPMAAVGRVALLAVALLLGVQIVLGGWVSTNYAVLACQDFPTCGGAWWPQGADWHAGFEWWRPLGRRADGSFLPSGALVAIHWAHRVFALALTLAAGWLALRLLRSTWPGQRRGAQLLGAWLAWQWISGMSNVVLGWPLVAALAHSAGAAFAVALMTWLVSTAPATQPLPVAHAGWSNPGFRR